MRRRHHRHRIRRLESGDNYKVKIILLLVWVIILILFIVVIISAIFCDVFHFLILRRPSLLLVYSFHSECIFLHRGYVLLDLFQNEIALINKCEAGISQRLNRRIIYNLIRAICVIIMIVVVVVVVVVLSRVGRLSLIGGLETNVKNRFDSILNQSHVPILFLGMTKNK